MGSAILVDRLSKAYGSNWAVTDASFEVQEGEIVGLLGPNGAGKTTIMECLEGLRRPSAGKMKVFGIDPQGDGVRLRRTIGVQLQSFGLPGTMRVSEAMRFFCQYHGIAPRFDMLERFGLGNQLAMQYEHLSTGQQRRLALALSAAHDPQGIFLDEPTSGLDVESRVELHRMLLEFRDAGKTVLVTTHDMAEAEKLCDRVVILLKGHVVATGTPREITAAGSGMTKVSVRSVGASLNDLAIAGATNRRRDGDYLVFFTDRPGPVVASVVSHIESRGDELIDLRVERPSLEERFLELTKAGGDPA